MGRAAVPDGLPQIRKVATPRAREVRHPLASQPPGTTFHLLNQYFHTAAQLADRLFVAESRAKPGQHDMVQRLVNIFHRTMDYEQRNIPQQKRPNQGVWEMMRHEYHGELYGLLHRNDVAGIADYLLNGLRQAVATGLGPGPGAFAACNADPATQLLQIILIRDRLVSLATALGVLPVENPEQGGYGQHMGRTGVELARMVQVELRTEIWRPPVMGLFGLDFDGNVLDARAAEDAYCAHRLRGMVPDHTNAVVAEIGAGFGGLALQGIRTGFRRYITFDLPLVTLLQGYFLMQVFGPDNVGLFGEDAGDRRIVLLPYWEFTNADHDFDLVVNRDSISEMPPPAAITYLKEVFRRGVPFLSINQESQAESGQADIPQLHVAKMARLHSDLVRTDRRIYWLRRGYVEEVYRRTTT
jgi:hypothetical protein